MNGIKEFVTINWDGEEYLANPGIESNDVLASGISISPALETGQAYQFDFELDLNGSSGLLFSPVGKETNVQLSSDWANPSFTGNFLPVNREVSSSGFTSRMERVAPEPKFSAAVAWTKPGSGKLGLWS